MATMTTSPALPRERSAFTHTSEHALMLEWAALPQPPRGAMHRALAAELAQDIQAAADAARAELFPALRRRPQARA